MEWTHIFDAIFSRVVLEALSIAASTWTSFVFVKTTVQIYINEKYLRKAAASDAFNRAIQSNDIAILGEYLTKTLGSISLHEYARHSDSAARIDKYLTGVEHFLAREADESKPPATPMPSELAKAKEEQNIETPSRARVPTSLAKAMAELRQGETWNALAALRRDIEIRLQNMLPAEKRIRMGPAHLIRHMRTYKLIPETTAELLRRSTKTATRAIHGEDVSLPEALAAFELALQAYRDLNWDN